MAKEQTFLDSAPGENDFDRRIFGHRLRHYRKRAGLTLKAVGEIVDRPSPYLSQLENGHTEPRLSMINSLADALGCTPADLMANDAPNRRAELELALEAAQADRRAGELNLPYVRPSAKLPDEVLEHIVSLHAALEAAENAATYRPGDEARRANATLRQSMRDQNNYFEDIEAAAAEVLSAVGYPGMGPVSERMLMDLAGRMGFGVERVQDIPRSTRSVSDLRNRTIYIPQRNSLSTRSARSVVLQTLGHFVLKHQDSDDFSEYVRQRVESNYFAAAVLAPEAAAVDFLTSAHEAKDISVEDLKEVFYISYEMAAHRLTNLATKHLDLTLHFLRSDDEGVIWKAYENDDVPLPAEADGTIEGQRLCREWGTRQAFESEDAFSLHYQYTDTANGEFWCVTYVEVDRSPLDAITVGTTGDQAAYFRGSDTTRRTVSKCPDGLCCRQPSDRQAERWRRAAWPSARDRSHVVSGLPTAGAPFERFPGVDMVEVFEFLDRHEQ